MMLIINDLFTHAYFCAIFCYAYFKVVALNCAGKLTGSYLQFDLIITMILQEFFSENIYNNDIGTKNCRWFTCVIC